LSEAQKRWAFRKKLSFKIGEPKFAMAEYAKVNRITFPLDNDGIILVTTELGVDVSKLVDKVIEIRNSLNNNVAGFYSR
jgi:peroxiredoxin